MPGLPPMSEHVRSLLSKMDLDAVLDCLAEVIEMQGKRFNQPPALLASVIQQRQIRSVPDAERPDGAA